MNTKQKPPLGSEKNPHHPRNPATAGPSRAEKSPEHVRALEWWWWSLPLISNSFPKRLRNPSGQNKRFRAFIRFTPNPHEHAQR